MATDGLKESFTGSRENLFVNKRARGRKANYGGLTSPPPPLLKNPNQTTNQNKKTTPPPNSADQRDQFETWLCRGDAKFSGNALYMQLLNSRVL